MTTLIVDINTLFKIMATNSPVEKPAIFYYYKNRKYIFYGFKGPITLKSYVTEKEIFSNFFAYYSGNKRDPSLALEKFSEIYLSRAIKVSSEE